MNVVITMAGVGSRFRQAGYNLPKYMIEARGRTLFEWSLLSLREFRQEPHIFIVRQSDGAEGFIREMCGVLGIGKFRIIGVDRLTGGQAETAMEGAAAWQAEDPLLIYNIDTYVEPGELRPELIKGDGFIPCFEAPGEQWSFVSLDGNGRAVEVREKKRISSHCSIGAYYFGSCHLYEKLYRELYEKRNYVEKGERYVAPMYNLLIENGGAVYIQDISTGKVHVLGTPEEVKVFAEDG